MKESRFFLTYAMVVLVQILICNYLNLSLFVALSLLPVIVLFIPIRYSTSLALFVAFISGLAVDYFAEGLVGLNALALLPVAFCRKSIINLVFGDEIFARKEDISINQHGVLKVSIAIIIAQSLFMLIYIWADGAATRPFWFNLTRFLMSVIIGWLISLSVSEALVQDRRER